MSDLVAQQQPVKENTLKEIEVNKPQENTSPNVVIEANNAKESKENFLVSEGESKVSLQDRFKQFKKQRHEKFKYNQYLKNKKINDRSTKEFQDQLRAKFVETAKKYLGVPYGKKYLTPDNPRYNSPIFLDCCALVRQVVYDLREDFGFTLARWNQAYQFDTLPTEVSLDKLKPGDLVFYSGIYTNPKARQQKHHMVHVEIFLGGPTGEQTIGSRWNDSVVSIFDTYKFSTKAYHSIQYYFKPIDTWLEGICKSYCEEHPWTDDRNNWAPDKFSIFADDEEAYCEDDETNEEVKDASPSKKKLKFEQPKNVIVGKGNNDRLISNYFTNEQLHKFGKYKLVDRKLVLTNKFDIKWVQTVSEVDYLSFKEGQQIVNHISNISIIGSKNGLIQTLRDFEAGKGEDYKGLRMNDFMPSTYRLDILSDEILFINDNSEGIWIVKPYGSNMARGIKIIKDIKAFKEQFMKTKRFYLGEYMTNELFGSKDAKEIVNKAEEEDNFEKIDTKIIIQKYIEKPLLINKRKFDMRCYVLIASTKPMLVFYHHGYIRLSLKDYTLNTTEEGEFDKIVHITNNSIQRRHPEYAELKEESLWSHAKFEKYLKDSLKKTDDEINTMNAQVKRILAHSIQASELKIDKKVGFFELLGCDIIFDENLKPYLIEFNSNPALFTETSAQHDVIPKVVQSTLDMVLDINSDFSKVQEKVADFKNLKSGSFEPLINKETGFMFN